MRRKTAVALVALASLVIAATAVAQSLPRRIDLPRGWQPEGIAAGAGNTLYVGSIPTGAVAASTRAPAAAASSSPGATGRAATGLKFAGGRLFVAGAGTGKAWVYNVQHRPPARRVPARPGAAPTRSSTTSWSPRSGAYFTDSRRNASSTACR